MRRLRAAGCVFAEAEADLLLAEARDGAPLELMVVAREAGLPLEQVVGWADFAGVRVRVSPGVFVPRRRSELVVRVAAGLVEPKAVVVDLCCGTGALAAALRARVTGLPGLQVYAADSDPAAVECAGANLPGAAVFAGDLYEALPPALVGRVDLLLVNAPYVPTAALVTMPPEAREHESRASLDGGVDGRDVQRRVVAGARTWLRAGGHLVLEAGRDQARGTAELMRAAGLPARVVTDDDLDATAVVGRAPGGGAGQTGRVPPDAP